MARLAADITGRAKGPQNLLNVAVPTFLVPALVPRPEDDRLASEHRQVKQPDRTLPKKAPMHQRSVAGGMSLDIAVRTRLARFFPKLDLAMVRVHADVPADRAIRHLRADAVAWGRDIFFRAGKFTPASLPGLALLGHELTHIQQTERLGQGIPVPHIHDLEREAAQTEKRIFSDLSLDGSGARPTLSGTDAFVTAVFPSWEPPLSFEHTSPAGPRPSMRPSAGDAHTAATAGWPPAPGAPSTVSVHQPLKADENRAAARDMSPPASAAGTLEDIEVLSRRLARAMTKQVAIERERRGVDRWAH